jgi:competence protein ComEA
MARTPERQRERDDFARRPIREQVMDLLALHAGERRGTVMLIGVLCLLMGWYAYQQWFRTPDTMDLEPMRAEMEAWLATRDQPEAPTALAEPFPFDPNSIDRAGWLRLGLSEKQASGIENYKAKGGRFRVKSDLGRMYTLRPEDYERLKPFIQLPDSLERGGYADRPKNDRFERDSLRQWPERSASTFVREPFRKVEVNTADTNMLVALPGIGPSFARGIVKYRESLGGYASLDQLAEVYVLKDKPDAVLKLKELLLLDTLMVRRIPINTCAVEELAAHPYARWRIAKPLIAYRTAHGPFAKVADIKGCALIDEEVFRKLAPYLTVE